MLAPFDAAALEMLKAARIQAEVEEVTVLADDLQAVADEWKERLETDTEEDLAYAATATLRERIGGLPQLRGYLDCLLAGKRRREKGNAA